MSLADRLWGWLRRRPAAVVHEETPAAPPGGRRPVRGSVDLVVILDGTMSTLDTGMETNAGLTFRLLTEDGPTARRAVYYEPGLQWVDWMHTRHIAQGIGIGRQIRRAYGWLASRYRPGDRIWLMGYSRGAFAVRSLGGMIDRVGLVRHDAATERNVTLCWRHYQRGPDTATAAAFRRRFCHGPTVIEMIGVWDTVKALGLRLPLLWMLTEGRTTFHNHQLGPSIRHGFQALALDETRAVFAPVLWDCPAGMTGHVEQMWFRGSHGDVGGHIGGFAAARPLANIPLVWMLDRAEMAGLALPDGWRSRFPCDPQAPMVGTWRGLGGIFLIRQRRSVGRDRTERLHPTVPANHPRRAWLIPGRG